MPDQPTVTYDTDGPLAIVAIDRPAVRNAVDPPRRACRWVPALGWRAVAAGSRSSPAPTAHFAPASTLGKLPVDAATTAWESGGAPMGPTRLKLSKPVIAAIEGPAVAGGPELALWCDLRVAARSAAFGVYCRRFGVPLLDLGTIRLPRLTGHSRAMDMILTGRGLSGEEVERIGLANRAVEPAGARGGQAPRA